MNEDIIAEKLDTLIKLTAASIIKEDKTQTKSILKLSGVGIGYKDIAKIIGATDNYVAMILSRNKNKAKDKKKGIQDSIENETKEENEIKEESNIVGDNNGGENNNGN